MNKKISVLIADDNTEFRNLLCSIINQTPDMSVTGAVADGLETLRMIGENSPDVVILDIIIPNIDGIGVLEKVAEMRLVKPPLFLMLSAVGQESFIQKALALGARYYIVKPFDINILIQRIRQLYEERNYNAITSESLQVKRTVSKIRQEPAPQDLEIKVTNLMNDAGIPVHMAGYKFLREAIIRAVDNSKVFISMTKVLYPEVAKKFGTSPQKVERCIRNAIDSAWAKRNRFSADTFGTFSRGKPTNSEFIAMIADKIRLDGG